MDENTYLRILQMKSQTKEIKKISALFLASKKIPVITEDFIKYLMEGIDHIYVKEFFILYPVYTKENKEGLLASTFGRALVFERFSSSPAIFFSESDSSFPLFNVKKKEESGE